MLKQKTGLKYSIENFIYHELPEGDIVVQSKQGIVKVTDQSMINFIKMIDNQELYRTIDESDIEGTFNEQTEEAIDFLFSYGIISNYNVDYNFEVKGYEFFSNDESYLKMIEFTTKEDYENKNLDINYHDNIDQINFEEDQFVSCFLNPYSKSLADEIVSRAKESNCTLLMAYTYNNNIYINNLYKETWKNPCHFCNFNHIESQLRIQEDGNVTYQHLVDLIYHEDPQFQIELKLSQKDLLHLVTQIVKIVDGYIVQDEMTPAHDSYAPLYLSESILINLLSNEVIKDFSIHSELCDCYE